MKLLETQEDPTALSAEEKLVKYSKRKAEATEMFKAQRFREAIELYKSCEDYSADQASWNTVV